MTEAVAPACRPPSRINTLLEVRAPIDWMTVALRFPGLLFAPKGDARPIMLSPGYMTDEYSMRPLKLYLKYLGYSVYDWGLGRNLGDVDGDIERAAVTLQVIAEAHQAPVTVIGWSLGGVISRELARLHHENVREVITMGTPVTGGPKYTAVGQTFAKVKGLDLDAFEDHVLERNKIGFEQPVTAIYSKSDGVVGWQAAVDVYNPQARNIEVTCSHLGIGINAKVWKIIAHTLSASTV